MAYLDNTGLTYFWGKIKSYVTSLGYITSSSVPTISTDISTDAASDVKTASPKAVKTYVDDIVGDIESLLAAI